MNSDIFLAVSAHAGKLPSAEEMAAFDHATIAQGTGSLELMERAGRGIFEELRRRFLSRREATTTVICGPGNNGGDGLVLSRYLHEAGYKVHAIVCCAERYSPDFKTQLTRYAGTGGGLFSFPHELAPDLPKAGGVVDLRGLGEFLRGSDIFVDALLGTGQKSGLRGGIRDAVAIISEVEREEGTRVIALDMPTGINGDNGQVTGPAVKADITLTIELVKRGMLQLPARDCCGEIHAVPIGIQCAAETEFELLHAALVPPLPTRPLGSHKGDFGHVLVAGGCGAMPGAPVLAGLAALRTGAGLVTKLHPGKLAAPAVPELLLEPVDSKTAAFDAAALADLDKKLSRFSCLVAGPGLGTAEPTAQFLLGLLKLAVAQARPVVLDETVLRLIHVLKHEGRR